MVFIIDNNTIVTHVILIIIVNIIIVDNIIVIAIAIMNNVFTFARRIIWTYFKIFFVRSCIAFFSGKFVFFVFSWRPK